MMAVRGPTGRAGIGSRSRRWTRKVRSRGADEGEGLRSVGAGLRLVLLGMAATVAVEVGFALAGAAHGRPAKDPAATIQSYRRSTLLRALDADRPGAATVLNGLVVLSCVLGIAGKVFCARGPEAMRASIFAFASIACDGLGLGLYAAGQVGPADEATAELGDLAPVAWLVAYFLFLRSLGHVAAYLRSPVLLVRTRRQQAGSLAVLLGTFAAVALASSGGPAAPLIVTAVLGLILFILYARLLRDLRRATESAADAGR